MQSNNRLVRLETYSDYAKLIIKYAQDLADRKHHYQVKLIHLIAIFKQEFERQEKNENDLITQGKVIGFIANGKIVPLNNKYKKVFTNDSLNARFKIFAVDIAEKLQKERLNPVYEESYLSYEMLMLLSLVENHNDGKITANVLLQELVDVLEQHEMQRANKEEQEKTLTESIKNIKTLTESIKNMESNLPQKIKRPEILWWYSVIISLGTVGVIFLITFMITYILCQGVFK